MTNHADMTVVGIGSMDEEATIIRNGILSKTDFALLKMQGAVETCSTTSSTRTATPSTPTSRTAS